MFQLPAVVDVPAAAAAADGCRLSLTLASPPGQPQLDNDVGFYQLPVGDVTLTADQLLSGQRALFSETGAGTLGEERRSAECFLWCFYV